MQQNPLARRMQVPVDSHQSSLPSFARPQYQQDNTHNIRSTMDFNQRPTSVPIDTVYGIFQRLDKDNNGRITADELHHGLINIDQTQFDRKTVRMLMASYAKDQSGTIDFAEFQSLWEYLNQWLKNFQNFDKDGNKTISIDEFAVALSTFNFNVSPQFVTSLFSSYDKKRRNALSFDLFVRAIVTLQNMTAAFHKYDVHVNGWAHISYEDFLKEVLHLIAES
ncbi:EF hand domain-containing protein [Lipomyces arxii]|uniref:EF hand domain-containing protein n=1 Tax=Lipomyces arxii TaxID=56418 RepID=UPI0034D00BB9